MGEIMNKLQTITSIMIMVILGMAHPLSAQGNVFATNTPFAGFATNTPETPPITSTPTTSTSQQQTGYDNYALRLWLADDMLDALIQQIEQITADDIDSVRRVELLQYELAFRFPDAPQDIAKRADLVAAMIAAPAGTVNMQAMIRPYITHAINNDLVSSGAFDGFTIEMLPANLDANDIDDAVVHITYRDAESDSIHYEDYALAIGEADGTLRILASNFDSPTVPYNANNITLDRISDANADGIDELVLIVDDGKLNQLMYIIGYRNGQASNLTLAGDAIRFGHIDDWNDGAPITTQRYQVEDEKWHCISELTVTWSYTDNFYRPSADTTFINQANSGCELSEAEPLFAMNPISATQHLTNTLVKYGTEATRTDRAIVTLAMLYTIDGQVKLATETATAALAISNDPNSWGNQQASLILAMMNEPNATAFDICVALAEADHGEVGACDVQALLGRVFAEAKLPANKPIIEQLEQIGLSVVQSTIIEEPGFANRTAVDFGIASAGWWAFVAKDGVYSGTPIPSPITTDAPMTSTTMITVPQAVYTAILSDDDIRGALNMIRNSRTNHPDTPFSEAFQFIEALSNDLLGNREAARRIYYDLWANYPDSPWGTLAYAHLEQR
jgi:hypothetical protein